MENAKEIAIIYGTAAAFAGRGIEALMDVAESGVCAVGIVIGGYLNYRMLSE